MTIGKASTVARVIFLPLIWFFQYLSHLDINYHAGIGHGMCILHANMGVVVNGSTIIGKNVIFVGGNVIGGNKRFNRGEFVIADNCTFGANAVVIGHVRIGDNVKVGASACVVKDVESGKTVVGVPAVAIN